MRSDGGRSLLGRLWTESNRKQHSGTSTVEHMFTDAGIKSDRSSRSPLECMVCGKLFPRGALDLSRHQTALTLQHAVSDKKTSACKFECTHCGYYFSSKDHLKMHSEQSSCGKRRLGFKIPENECIICGKEFSSVAKAAKHEHSHPNHIYSSSKRLSMQYMCGNCGLWFVSEDIIEQHAKDSFCNTYRRGMALERSNSSTDVDSKSESRAARKTKRHVDHTSADNALGTVQPKKSRSSAEYVASERKPKSDVSVTNEHTLRKTNRTKSIVPIERKALYAICSLLADNTSVVDAVDGPDEDTILHHIPNAKRDLISRLMQTLNYTC